MAALFTSATPTQVPTIGQLDPTAQAATLGYPATLFGYTPAQREYWHEPGMPLFTPEMFMNAPADNREGTPDYYKGWPTVPCIGDVDGDHMAPRFPRGCAVNTMPVFNKGMLVVGRVYTYCYVNEATGREEWNMARLLRIGGNYLEVKPDNGEQVSLWLLRDNAEQATWDVREVTHYAAYPGEAE